VPTNADDRWEQNRDEGRTVTHPDWPRLLGGVQHLPPDEQKRVQETVPVPPHPCCEDPVWLYRIFQDTTVDVGEVLCLLPARSSCSSRLPYY